LSLIILVIIPAMSSAASETLRHTLPPLRALGTPPPNFLGSATPSDWLFDLNAPIAQHPPDVLAYLYLIGSESPTNDGYDWDASIAAGVERLLAAQASGRG
jgi:hypothetical protein